MVKILIAEDAEDTRFAYEAILSKEGHDVVAFENGEKALLFLKDNKVDLILTDLIMPVIDGIVLTLEVLKMPDPPKILAVTGGGEHISAAQTLDVTKAMFDDALEKPVSCEKLLQSVRKLID